MSDSVNIFDYFKVIKKHWRIIAVLFIVTEIVTLIFTLKQDRVYEATATILSPEIISEGKPSGLSSLLSEGIPAGLFGNGAASQAIIAMLKSRRMAECVARNFNLTTVYKTDNNIAAAEKVRSMTKVFLSRDNIILVKVGAPTPKLAADIANFYSTNLDSLNESLKISPVKPVATLLDSALPSKFPVRPKMKLNLLVSGILALLVGILVVFVLEYIMPPGNGIKRGTAKV